MRRRDERVSSLFWRMAEIGFLRRGRRWLFALVDRVRSRNEPNFVRCYCKK